ncbi:hypothetical protein Tco_1478578, partial [Tanacetum coccineum]
TSITLSLPPLNLLHSNPVVLNGGLEQQDLSPFEGTQSLVLLKIEVSYEVVDTLVSMIEESKLVESWYLFVEETV